MREKSFFSSLRFLITSFILLVLLLPLGPLPVPALASPARGEETDFLLITDSDFEIETWQNPENPWNKRAPSILVVESLPLGAAVYLNNTYAGMTPLTLGDLPPGGYRISLQRKSYRDISVFVTLDPGRTSRILGHLRAETGSLRVKASPEDAEIYVDGNRIWAQEEFFPIGSHSVLVRRFGYEDFTAQVWISAGRTTEMEAELSPADFAIQNFSISRQRLNPENPGLTGQVDLSFYVSAPGSGRLVLYDSQGTAVRSHDFPIFSRWKQSFRWDGRDDEGQSVPEGIYHAQIGLESLDGELRENLEGYIQVDRNLVIRYRGLLHGQPGLLYAPLSSSLPPGSFQLSSRLAGELGNPPEKNRERRYLAQLGAVLGVAPGLELTPHFSLFPQQEEIGPRLDASLGAKKTISGDSSGPFSLATTLGLHLSNQPSYSGLSRFPGFSAGMVFGLRFGPLGLIAAPELLASPLRIGGKGDWEWAGIDGALLSRFGAFLETRSLLAGLSTVLALQAGASSPRLVYPLHSGIEIHGLFPNSLVFLSTSLSWEYSPGDTSRFFLGAGLGILY